MNGSGLLIPRKPGLILPGRGPGMIIPGRRRPLKRQAHFNYSSVTGGGGGPAPPAGGYFADAVRFNTDRLHTAGADLSPNANGKLGILSFWFKRKGGVGATRFIWHSDGGSYQCRHMDTNQIILSGSGFDLRTTTAISDTTTWHHYLAAWDRGNGIAQLFIDDADDANVGANTDEVFDYTRFGHAVGSLESVRANTWDAEVADYYQNWQEFLDMTVVANRRKFRDAAGKPVDLGIDGALPTGTGPRVFFTGDAAVWNAGTNAGTSQDFTMHGGVTDATSSPSD